mmetsp:Transcript_11976/g.26479  ORF Transcript_11976/g.26479 Transcript_11976/m.26479 type:complete len:203 (-) Transcript_11976:1316-1924(-)
MEGASDAALSCCSPVACPSPGGPSPSTANSLPNPDSSPGSTPESAPGATTSPAASSEGSAAASGVGGASWPPSDCASAAVGAMCTAGARDGLASSSSDAFHPIFLKAEPAPSAFSTAKLCAPLPAVLCPQVEGCKPPHLKASSSLGTSGSGTASTCLGATFSVTITSGGSSTGACGSASGSVATAGGCCEDGGGPESTTASG